MFQCQFQGANQKTFVGGLALGAAGTIPFGHTEALNPLGSCAANPDGPIADGTQLTDITQDPGLKNVSGSSSAPSKSSASKPQKTSSAPAAASTTEATATTSTEVSAAPPAETSSASSSSSSSNFQLQNALDAQELNAQFQTLTADSSCSGTFATSDPYVFGHCN